jgi:hypothetical protein
MYDQNRIVKSNYFKMTLTSGMQIELPILLQAMYRIYASKSVSAETQRLRHVS